MAGSRVLYWGSGSAPCWRVQACLLEKDLEYESKMISFSDKGHKGDDVMAINPRGQVPAFKDGSTVVNDSVAALLYLEHKYPSPSLMPSAAYSQVLQRLLEVTSLQSMGRSLATSKGDAAAFDTALQAFKTELGYWEQYLGESMYVAGKDFSLADLGFAPMVLSWVRYGASLDSYPKLQAYAAHVKDRKSIKDTWPPHWKDTAGQDLLKGHV